MPHFVEDMVFVFLSFFQDKGSLFSFYNACYLSTALQLHVAYSIVHRSALLTTYLVGYGCVCAICYLLVLEIFLISGLMPCLSKTDNVVGCKLVSVYPQNSSKYGISSHIVYVLLFDATTGALLAFMVC